MQINSNINASNGGHNNVMSDSAFSGFQNLIFKAAGITMSNAKKSLVTGRLSKRLRALDLYNFDDYLKYLGSTEAANNNEFQMFTDLLTTNETYFYREPQHFDFLEEEILNNHNPEKLFRVWSAASSSGEEAYTLAMILAESLGVTGNWEVIGTDISTRMIKTAKQGIYSDHRVRMVPANIRYKYLLKGTKEHRGFVAVVPELKKHVRFEHYNLVASPNTNEMFDVIFCRNVLIYFNQDTKKIVMDKLCRQLKYGSYLMTGHSESLHGMFPELKSVKPSVYLKTGIIT